MLDYIKPFCFGREKSEYLELIFFIAFANLPLALAKNKLATQYYCLYIADWGLEVGLRLLRQKDL